MFVLVLRRVALAQQRNHILYVHWKLSQVNEVDYQTKKSWQCISTEITIQHCSAALSSFISRALFTKEKCLRWKQHTRKSDASLRRRVWTRKTVCSEEENMCVVFFWKPNQFKRRRALVHPYVFKIVKFSSSKTNNTIFFSQTWMGAS